VGDSFKFSVIIPTYNRKDLLVRAVNSVLCQTIKDYEIIVIDDGSNDGTHKIFEEDFYQNIKYFKIENSGGPALPRNMGIEAASGEWICFLDSDDYWFSNKLERILYFIELTDFDILYHNLQLNDNNSVIKGMKFSGDLLANLLNRGNGIPLSSSVIKRNVLNGVRFNQHPNLSSLEDFLFWIDLSEFTNRYYLVDEILGYYHLDTNIRITQFNYDSAKKYVFLKQLLKKRINSSSNYSFNFINYCIGLNLYKSKQYSKAKKYFIIVVLTCNNLKFSLRSLYYLIKIISKL
jgi:glycosyltransferase involved in cell wall biosynthesis